MSDELKKDTNADNPEEIKRTDPKDLIGSVIHGYKIVHRIGQSLVFLAYQEDPDPKVSIQQVAIKIFFPDPYACNREEIIQRLNSIRCLDHENIVKVYDVGEEKDFIYVVMEYVPGENLYDLMQRNPRLHWAAAAELSKEIIRGLFVAHSKGIMHRNLHPDRVLLGKGGQIKINFCNEGEITPSSEIVYYVAPELFLGKNLEEPADIYSLGSIIYTIVTGKPPLVGKTPKEVALKHRELAPILPSYGVADIPHSLSLILSRSLNTEAKQRYQHSVEVRAAINNFLINDIGSYKPGSYKQLLPKVVEIAEKAFDEAINIERDKKRKNTETGTDTSEVLEEKQETEKKETQKIEKKQKFLSLFWKVWILCIISLLLQIGIIIFLFFYK